MFTSPTCESGSEELGTALARKTGCAGIPVLADGEDDSEAATWCGEADDWAGLFFESAVGVNCVRDGDFQKPYLWRA